MSSEAHFNSLQATVDSQNKTLRLNVAEIVALRICLAQLTHYSATGDQLTKASQRARQVLKETGAYADKVVVKEEVLTALRTLASEQRRLITCLDDQALAGYELAPTECSKEVEIRNAIEEAKAALLANGEEIP